MLPEYEAEVEMLFKEYIWHEAENALNRKHYVAICEIIQKYKKVCGIENAAEVKSELIQGYPKRRIFINELQKLK